MKKVTIYAQGGGLVTSYHAGVIRALREKYKIESVNRIVAASGAAATFTYFVSKQYDFIEKIWMYLLESGGLVDLIRHLNGRGVIDIDFLVDEVIKNKFPLDLETLRESDISLDISVTEANTGKGYFFSKDSSVNFYELLRASMAIPYFYGKKVKLNESPYYDGTIVCLVGLDYLTEEEKNIIILTRPDKPIKKWTLIRSILKLLLLRDESTELSESIMSMPKKYNNLSEDLERLRRDRNIVVIQPSSYLPVKRLDVSPHRLSKTIEQGYKDTLECKDLERFWQNLI